MQENCTDKAAEQDESFRIEQQTRELMRNRFVVDEQFCMALAYPGRRHDEY